MAEGGNDKNKKNTLPQRGKVQQERQKWAMHEDGAIAYNMQSEEFDRHYGNNRFNRRTVRDDIPIAKIVQTDEEVRQQNERFEQLQALKAQAEEDERVAKLMLEQEQLQTEAHRVARELTDEEFAKAVQEKEKQKYEKYLSKKKSQKLKQERQEIERTQQQRTEEAGLAGRGSGDGLEGQVADLQLENGRPAAKRYNKRITPDGKIEDEGDFSDFYNLPEHVDPAHRQVLQELQDEELAKLLQEQEHKRTKAEVDRNKLKEIEEQDKRLAEIIQEQEKIKLKKAKQKHKQKEEQRRAQEVSQRPPALPPRNHEHDHRRYRRNSFIQSMENGPDQADNPGDPQFLDHDPQDGYMTPMQVAEQQRLEQQRMQQASGQPRSAGAGRQASEQPRSASGGRSASGQPRASAGPPGGGAPPVGNRQDSRDNMMNNSRQQQQQRQHQQQQMSQKNNSKQNSRQSVQNVKNNLHSGGPAGDPRLLPQNQDNMPDVERWLASQPPDAARGRLRSDQSDEFIPDSPSPPGSYHSEDAFPHGYSRSPPHNTSVDTGSHYAVSDPFNFNIATAIDPTYTRRSMDGGATTERKQPVQQQQQPVTRTVPHDACTELEWDPSVRGSIRRGSLPRYQGSAACYKNGYQDRTISTMSSGGDSFPEEGGPGVVSPFAPVQGQKRTGAGGPSRKSRKPDQHSSHSTKQKDKDKCKQQ